MKKWYALYVLLYYHQCDHAYFSYHQDWQIKWKEQWTLKFVQLIIVWLVLLLNDAASPKWFSFLMDILVFQRRLFVHEYQTSVLWHENCVIASPTKPSIKLIKALLEVTALLIWDLSSLDPERCYSHYKSMTLNCIIQKNNLGICCESALGWMS